MPMPQNFMDDDFDAGGNNPKMQSYSMSGGASGFGVSYDAIEKQQKTQTEYLKQRFGKESKVVADPGFSIMGDYNPDDLLPPDVIKTKAAMRAKSIPVPGYSSVDVTYNPDGVISDGVITAEDLAKMQRGGAIFEDYEEVPASYNPAAHNDT
jgi:hypothetical protein